MIQMLNFEGYFLIVLNFEGSYQLNQEILVFVRCTRKNQLQYPELNHIKMVE